MKSRNDIGAYLNELGLIGDAVEVGVFDGVFSEIILSTWLGKTLFLIDPWAVVPGYEVGLGRYDGKDFNTAIATGADWDKVCDSCEKRISRFGARAVMMKDTSLGAAGLFLDESLDFIYIDGDHRFEMVQLDLALWYPKLKSGGLFSGHDYLLGTGSKKRVRQGGKWKSNKRYQVKEAVDIFAITKGLKVQLTEETNTDITWYFLKP